MHERHARNTSLPRLAGWWGTDRDRRFRMEPDFVPRADVESWQVSNPPILSLAPVRISLELVDRVGVQVPSGAPELSERMRAEDGVICDEREPNVIRLAPTPLYNTHHDA